MQQEGHIKFTQLIWEGDGRWIHISYVPGDLRCQVIEQKVVRFYIYLRVSVPTGRETGGDFCTPSVPLRYTALHCPFGDSSGKLKLPSSQPTLILRALKGRQFL